jgi:hypothetical protein
VRPSLVMAALFLGVIVSPRANASPLYYTLTDLGTSDTLQTDANGDTYGVTNAAGTVTYALDKTPVTESVGPMIYPIYGGYYRVTTFQTQGGSYTDMESWSASGNYRNDPFIGPVTSVNIQGSMIGPSFGGLGLLAHLPGYGLYEGLLGQSVYTPPATVPASQFHFTSGQVIDDLNRIVADGNDGHDYLLTPTSLGTPQTVPEPSTLIVFGLVAAALMAHHARRPRHRDASPR